MTNSKRTSRGPV